eukprot:4473075-Pyramimonas_sp.AAC.1
MEKNPQTKIAWGPGARARMSTEWLVLLGVREGGAAIPSNSYTSEKCGLGIRRARGCPPSGMLCWGCARAGSRPLATATSEE